MFWPTICAPLCRCSIECSRRRWCGAGGRAVKLDRLQYVAVPNYTTAWWREAALWPEVQELQWRGWMRRPALWQPATPPAGNSRILRHHLLLIKRLYLLDPMHCTFFDDLVYIVKFQRYFRLRRGLNRALDLESSIECCPVTTFPPCRTPQLFFLRASLEFPKYLLTFALLLLTSNENH